MFRGDGPILHVLADQVADEFAGSRIDIFVARTLIYLLSQSIGQVHVETAAQDRTPSSKSAGGIGLAGDGYHASARSQDGRVIK
jgi:hypothetical protein